MNVGSIAIFSGTGSVEGFMGFSSVNSQVVKGGFPRNMVFRASLI